jgi:nucleoside-diphosphate-sugar epimerase
MFTELPSSYIYIYIYIYFQKWYYLSKTEAEIETWDFAKRSGLDVVTVCPSLVLGPILQPTVNASSLFIIRLLKGTCLLTLYLHCIIPCYYININMYTHIYVYIYIVEDHSL